MSVNICSIGDIMLGENVHHFRRGIATKYRNQFHRLVPPAVMDVLNEADLVVGNFECSLMKDEALKNASLERAMYTAPESSLTCFEHWNPPLVLNVANNHFGQHGGKAMEYTIDRLRDRGIHIIGRGKVPLELNINGHMISLLGVSLVPDACQGGYFKSSPATLLQDLEWGPASDGVSRILSIHWGDEYLTLPSAVQQELAEKLAESGVDLILGHHPHVIQPVRQVGNTTAAYSHGNFIFDQNFSRLTRTGLMMMSALSEKRVRCFKLYSSNYRIHSVKEIKKKSLEAFCRRQMNSNNPLIMRILMKLEMMFHPFNVPKEVWRHFLLKLIDKRLSS